MDKAIWRGHDPEFSRRALLKTGGLLGLGGALAPVGARAAGAGQQYTGKTITFASWGGAYQDAQIKAWCDPFAAKTGATVLQASPMNFAKLRAMVQSGHPVWDIVDVTIQFLFDAEKSGLFEKIDPKIVHVDRIAAEYRNEYGAADAIWSSNIAYPSIAFPGGKGPASWAEVFDLKRFPGTRTLEDRVAPTLEVALMADGVPPGKLYPLDVTRAFKKLDTVRKDTIFWTTDAQAEELFTDGGAVCGMIANGRAYDAVQKGAKITLEWNQHVRMVDYLVMPKGSRNVDVAMGLIDEMTVAKNQAKFTNLIPYSPTNPDAFKWIDKKILPWLPTSPENASKGFVINATYWRDHYEKLALRWENWKLS